MKAKSIFFTLTLVLILAISIFPVSAQESFSPNVQVSDDGTIAAMPEVSGPDFAKPFRGSGKLLEGGPMTIPEAELNATPLDGGYPESVIGADGRSKITATTAYPSRAIAYLVITYPKTPAGYYYSCTGWFIGNNTLATAGHCVYNKAQGGWATSLKVYPGRNGSVAPYGYTTKKALWSVSGWVTSSNHEYDYGAIKTTAAMGNTVGWFGFRWQSSNSFPGTYTVRGYPGDKPTGTMWTMSGGIVGTASSPRKLFYQMDTYGGQSGSPIYHYCVAPTCSVAGYYGVGIHAYGVGISPYSSYNSGTRITSGVFTNLKNWKALP